MISYDKIETILIIQTASIGDVVLATALLEQLHDALPMAKIDFLVKNGMQPLFDKHPFVNQLIVWNKKKKITSWLQLLKTVRKKHYNLVVDIQRFLLTGLLTVLSGADETRGFDKNPCSMFFSKAVKHTVAGDDSEHVVSEIERNASLVSDIVDLKPSKPKVYPPTVDMAKLNITSPYYTISPGSLWFTKRLPMDKWKDLLSRMPHEATVVILGDKSDGPRAKEIIALSQRRGIVDMTDKFTLLQSAEVMRGAVMNYVNDSAPLHLASAVNAPVTAFYCSTIPYYGFTPTSDISHIVENKNCPCRPCGLHGRKQCPKKHFRCANDIDIEGVPLA